MNTTALNTLTLDFPSNFTTDDREINRRKYESEYISSVNLPTEARIRISSDAVKVQFFYDFGIEKKQVKTFPNVSVEVGEKSKRIYSLDAPFGSKDFPVVMRRLDNIRDAITEMKKSQPFDIQASYGLLHSLLTRIGSDIESRQREIEAEVLSR